MQSIFRLPWCSDFATSKFVDKIALEKMRPAQMVDIPMFNQLKRKRSDDVENLLPSAVPAKKQRPDSSTSSQFALNAHVPQDISVSGTFVNMQPSTIPRAGVIGGQEDAKPGSYDLGTNNSNFLLPAKPELPSLSTDTNVMAQSAGSPEVLTPLQQTIENEFNMQILMKHNELRLIEQELAKCQIALEQLRRCEVRPFPGADKPSCSVSEGRGPAVMPPPGFSRPTHPAPYGVTDGPYSRHYRQWLLHDPHFDPAAAAAVAQADEHPDARSTRYNGMARKSVSKPVQPSSRRSDSLNSIPNYPSSASKDKSALLVLRRSTDNQLVKLICNNCHRGNFSSIQGFLNHCRIAHKVDYKSHDLAAIDCGHPLDEGELAKIPPETHALTAPKPPPASRTTSVSSTPVRSHFVHPLNTSVASSAPPLVSKPQTHLTPVRSLAPAAPSNQPHAAFKPSAQLPHLSKLFKKSDFGVDLEQAAAAAKQKIDIGHDEVWSPDASQHSSPVDLDSGARRPASSARPLSLDGGADSPARPASRKGYRQPAVQRQRPVPLMSSSSSSRDVEMVQSPNDMSATFSPHTVDSNPGLVSDHEDDDHGSASEEETPHGNMGHRIPVARHCSDNMQIDIDNDHDELEQQHGVIIRRNSISASEARGMGSAGSVAKKLGGSGGARK